jgi:hypothetical protein
LRFDKLLLEDLDLLVFAGCFLSLCRFRHRIARFYRVIAKLNRFVAVWVDYQSSLIRHFYLTNRL